MKIPRVRRRWVVLAILVVVVVATIRLLDQPLALQSYRAVEPQSVVVSGYGTKSAWIRVTGLTETEAAVTVGVNSLEFLGFLPHSDAADLIEVEVQLSAPLGGRAVIDANTGLPLTKAE
jgi:acyl dehydratase